MIREPRHRRWPVLDARVLRTFKGVCREIAGAVRTMADHRSLARYAIDVVLYRVLRVIDLPLRYRTVRLRDGSTVTYRLNRGDIQTVREVWISEAYRLPFQVEHLQLVVDLGTNIGLTSVYLARRYGSHVLAVEPSEENARLARSNLRQNHVAADVVHAAIGPADTTATFAAARDFNTGRLGAGGREIIVFSMPTLLSRLGADDRVDLLKVDIEGAEEALFMGDTAWLDRVDALIIELHPTLCNSAAVIAAITGRGFRHLPGGSVHPMTTDAFVRIGGPLDRSAEVAESSDARPALTVQ